jgi:hypothetical protein
LQAGLGAAADAVWGHCVGYGGLADLPRYLCHNEIALSVLFAQFPEASVADIQGALNVRARLLAFAKKHQGTRDVGDLRQAWTAEFGRVGPRATGG